MPLLSPLQQQVLARARAVGDLVESRDVAAAELIDELESLKNTVAAAQARLAVALRETRVRERAHRPAAVREKGVAAELALARRESPHRGAIHLGLAGVLCAELPHTLAAMEAGWCGEWRAVQIAQGTACLSRADRAAVDAELMAEQGTTHGWGDRRFRAEVDRRAYALDPAAAVARHRRAVGERHTSIRPAADGMVRLSALLPMVDGIAAHADLLRAATSARTAGDPRTRGQVMADTLLDRVLGRAATAPGSGVAVTVNVTVSDATLLGVPGPDGDQPGWLSGPLGSGTCPVPLPADLVRDLVARADAQGLAALRRLYTRPRDGALVALESSSRRFPAGLAAFLEHRDRTCRTPWCDAPVRHHDHVTRHSNGGPTTAMNGQGLCEACNHAKEAEGWQSRSTTATDRLHEVLVTTPSGSVHHSRAPGLPPPLRSPGPAKPAGAPRIELAWAA